MITTRKDARRIIHDHYGDALRPRFTTRCSIGIRPTHEVHLGRYVLAWQSLAPGGDSAVRIGRMRSDLTINWDWSSID